MLHLRNPPQGRAVEGLHNRGRALAAGRSLVHAPSLSPGFGAAMAFELSAESTAEYETELSRLKEEHRDLDDAIEALSGVMAGDRLQLQRLKKRKLALRDRISFLEDQLTPDIIA